MTAPFFTDRTPVTDDVLKVIAHLPTRSLPWVAAPGFFQKMTDADFIRLAVLLAQKSYEEGLRLWVFGTQGAVNATRPKCLRALSRGGPSRVHVITSKRSPKTGVFNIEQLLGAIVWTLSSGCCPMRSPVQLRPYTTVILCIDDDEAVLECEKAFLESFGYTVWTAPSGGEGLKLACKHSVDVVIVDYFMPEMNGHEVAVEVRRIRPQAKIILLSGAVDIPEQALNRVDAFVAKGRLTSQLLPAIAQLQEATSGT